MFERISVLMKYGSLPYIMRYEKYKTSRFRGMYVELARWCNQPQFFKKKSFREFCVANQEYKKDQTSNCAAYQTMLDFEAEFPDIASKYFDLKYDQENIYKHQYGYGRRYENKPLCSFCRKNGTCWQEIFKNDMHIEKKFIQKYYEKEIDLQCLTYKNSECKNMEEIVDRFIEILLKYSIDEIIDIIISSDNLEEVSKDNIPQLSKPDDAMFGVIQVLIDSGEILTFEELGYYLEKKHSEEESNTVAQKKYGENHSKLAALMDLVVIGKNDNRAAVYASVLGEKFYQLDFDKKNELGKRLLLRIPIIQNVFVRQSIAQIDGDMEILSVTTKKRRRSSVINVIRSIIGDNEKLSNRIEFEGE